MDKRGDEGRLREADLEACRTVAARSGCIVAITYYEFSRASPAKADVTPGYLLSMYCAFSLGVLATLVSAAVELFARRAPDPKRAVVPAKLCRGGYSCWVAAFFFYCVSFMLMGDFHNPGMSIPVGQAQPLLLWLGKAPFWPLLLCVACVEPLFFGQLRPMPDDQAKELMSKLSQESLRSLAELVASRSVFLLGILGHALARWQAAPVLQEFARPCLLNHIYFLCAAWSFVCLAVALRLATLVSVYSSSIQGPAPPLELVRAFQFCRAFFLLGVGLTLATCMLFGWGCSEVHSMGDAVVGARYVQVALVPSVICGIAVLAMGWSALHLAREASGESLGTTAFKSYATIASSTGSPCGFLMYNIATFETDVLAAPLLQPETAPGFTVFASLFLLSNWLSVAAGAVVQILNGEMEALYVKGFAVTGAWRRQMSLLELSGQLAFIGFLISCSLLCVCKHNCVRLEPLAVCFAAIVAVFAMQRRLLQDFQRARASTKTTPPSGFDIKLALLKAQLAAHSQSGTLFAVFAYNAVSFLFRCSAPFSPFYALLMTLCFTSAIGVGIFRETLGAFLALLEEDSERASFADAVQAHIHKSVYVSIFSMGCFWAAFSIMGCVKTWSYGLADEAQQAELASRFRFMQAAVAGSVMIVCCCAALWLHRTYNKALPASEMTARQQGGDDSLRRCVDDVQFCASIASMPVGNVFFEILFAAVSADAVATWCYFGLAMLAFGAGVVVLLTASVLLYFERGLLGAEARKEFFACARHFPAPARLCCSLSLLAWLVHFGFSARLKYPPMAPATAILAAGIVGSSIATWTWLLLAVERPPRQRHAAKDT